MRSVLALPRPLARLAAVAALVLGVAAVGARPLPAQFLTRPQLDWRTLETEHFVFHFPADMTAWTRDVAERMEEIHEAVTTLVGYTPQRRVTVMVEDPSNVSNGFALPFRDAPTVFLWPTPPDPISTIAHNRGWGELLAVHEFAHIAHLVRPTRAPLQRRLWQLLPVELGPVARRAPRWVTEGYATYVEGVLTGSGRPAGAARAAVLRQWALEGQLPTYAQLNGSMRFQGGAMAYLAGSAFLEWLVAREGEQSLRDLWRRMSARQDRGFVPAFVGVFGAPPDELYGRFTAELTGRALAVEDTLEQRGLRDGELVQRLSWATGQPAVSPDGSRLALVLRSPTRPSRLVVWRTAEPVDTAARRRARARLLEADPQDVLPVERRPRPRRAIATLHPVAGRAHDEPRFLPDGRSLLVVRSVPVGDGTERPDLFEWRFVEGGLRRITRGAAIREADPAPDGRTAAGVRCMNGICDVVRIALASGAVEVIAPGSPDLDYWQPRVSPDGRRVLVSVHAGGRWRLGELPMAGGALRIIDPGDGASRYGATYLPGGQEAVTTSERGGIAHLERIVLATGAVQPLTRTTGAHVTPAVDSATRDVYFLSLHARGYDLRRVHADSLLDVPAQRIAGTGYPVLPPAMVPVADTFARAPLPPATDYGLGPRRHRLLPGTILATEGALGTLAFNGIDPVGRFGWVLQGSAGEPGTWRGASLAAELRTQLPYVHGQLFATRHEPTRQREGAIAASTIGGALDVDYLGAALGAHVARDLGAFGWSAATGASLGRLDDGVTPETARSLAYLTASGTLRWQRGRNAVSQRLTLHGGTGRTGDEQWLRGIVTAEAAVALWGLGGRGLLRYGRLHGGDDERGPAYEQFVVGGVRSPLVSPALLPQRLAMPALPFAVATGDRVLEYRAETQLLGTTVYYAGASAGTRIDDWHRVVGAEWELTVPAVAFVALPSVRVLGGGGYALDEPFRRRPRAYLVVTYAP